MKFIIGIIITVILYSCHSGGIVLPPSPVFSFPVSPIYLSAGDSLVVNLPDYFPNLSLLTKISGSKELEIRHEKGSPDLHLAVSPTGSPLAHLTFRYDGFNYDIPVLTKNEKAKDIPMIFTDKIKGDTIILRSNRPMKKWAVYVQNYRLRKKLFMIDTNHMAIVLPNKISQLKNSAVRVWATDGTAVSNDVYIPLVRKNVIRNLNIPDSLREQIFPHPGGGQDVDTAINRAAGRIFLRQSDKFPQLHGLLADMQAKYGTHNNKRYILTEPRNKIPGFQVADSSTYNKLLQLWTFHVTIPGNPEICPADSLQIPPTYHDDLQTLKNRITQLNNLSYNNIALLYGDFIPLRLEDRIYAYMRSYFGQEIIVVFNKKTEAVTLRLDLPEAERKKEFQSLFDNRFSYDNSRLILDVPAHGVEVIYN